MNTTIAGNVVRGYVQDWPDTPSHTLASKLYKEHPKLFTNIEHARSQVRYYRGQNGGQNRVRAGNKALFKKEGSPNPFKLPKSYAKKRKPVELDGTNFLLLYDIHIPYHDSVALDLAIEEGVKQGCDSIFLGGDVMDCHLLSNFVKEPDARNFQEELDATRQFLKYLRSKFPTAKIYYKEANHEERYWKYMRVKAPELLDIRDFNLQSFLGLKELGIEWVHGRTKALIGKLSLFHGHEFGKSVFSPVNVARGLYLRAKASAVCGHSHQTSEHTERDVNDKIITTWSIGCLSELSPEYSPFNKWNHGFAIVKKSAGDFHVQNFRIYNGRLL